MKRNLIILIVIAVLVVGVVAFRFITKEDAHVKSIDDLQKEQGVPVNTQLVEPAVFQRWRAYSGQVESKQQAVLYANIPARVRKVYADQGAKVYPGKLILSLDPLSASQTYSAQNAARIQAKDAKRVYDRLLPLYKAGAISKEELDQAKSRLDMARAQLTDTSYTTQLKSPIKGTLTDLRVSEGDKVDPGVTVAVVADTSGSKLIMDVSQTDVEELKVGQKVAIGQSEDTVESTCEGCEISKISYSADMKTRLFRVEVKLDGDRNLRPGTLRFVRVLTYENDEALAVPMNAVMTQNGDRYLYVVTKDGNSEKRTVKVGSNNGAEVEILSGLSTGDQVVVWGQNRLVGGEKVKVVKSETK